MYSVINADVSRVHGANSHTQFHKMMKRSELEHCDEYYRT